MTTPTQSLPRTLRASTAALLVVASMVGAGVFTTTGFLVRDLGAPLAVLLAWAVGGVVALCGALAYAELVTALPDNGGEYRLLGRIYHPAVGFVAGWISLIVGFSAPMAASALAFGEYLGRLFPEAALSPSLAGLALILGLALLHALRVRIGGAAQDLVTALLVAMIVAFIAAGLWVGDLRWLTAPAERSTLEALASPEFAVGLVFVSFAYSGWNAAAYLAGEIERPSESVPKALVLGTGAVALLYVGLNLVFLIAGPPAALAGVVEVGYVAALGLFGPTIGALMTVVVALGLLTTVSALMMAGPRVYEAMGADYPRLGALASRSGSARAGPTAAIVLQVAVASVMVLTAAFDELLAYMGLTLALSSALTIAGVFVLRRREPALARPYRTWAHPWTTSLALALMLWMAIHTVGSRPVTALVAAATALGGLGLYALLRPRAAA
ncbi:MAG: amino acid permease [Nannocystis sp.]|nr:amino acid permease [Nannocystis sp.]